MLSVAEPTSQEDAPLRAIRTEVSVTMSAQTHTCNLRNLSDERDASERTFPRWLGVRETPALSPSPEHHCRPGSCQPCEIHTFGKGMRPWCSGDATALLGASCGPVGLRQGIGLQAADERFVVLDVLRAAALNLLEVLAPGAALDTVGWTPSFCTRTHAGCRR
jgi:hypothetical protein